MSTPVVIQPSAVQTGEPVNTNLPLSIVACLCCNGFCLGLVAVICSLQANNAVNEGKTAEAREKAEKAKKFAMAAIVVSIILYIIIIILKALGL